MSFSEAEKQILIAINWLSRRRPPDRATLQEKKHPLFDQSLVDWHDSIDVLIDNGSVVETDGRLWVSDHIRSQVDLIVSEWLAEGFNDTLLKSEKSRAYSHFCELVYGKDLCQYSMMDMRQLGDLLDILSANESTHIIDLGCALGVIDEYISDTTGARITGVDIAAQVIDRATERTKHKRDRVSFEVQNMDDLSLEAGLFDVVISVDSLYFVRSLKSVIERCRQICRPDGRFGFFYSQVIRESDSREILHYNGTELARALIELGITYEVRDYSDAESLHWKTSRRVADDLKAEFEAEGNIDLYESRVKEANVLIKAIDEDRVRRYLYYGYFRGSQPN